MPLLANSVVFLEMTILVESGVTFFEHEKKVMPLSANSVVFLEITILAERGVTFFEHEKNDATLS